MLSGEAWKCDGCQWRAWSSRLISTTLKVGVGRSAQLHVFSCYAPTYTASREEKDNFFEIL